MKRSEMTREQLEQLVEGLVGVITYDEEWPSKVDEVKANLHLAHSSKIPSLNFAFEYLDSETERAASEYIDNLMKSLREIFDGPPRQKNP